jgi:hypothetical protein
VFDLTTRYGLCHRVVALKQTTLKGASMGEVITIGLDIAKCVFQVHALMLRARL